MRHNIYIRQEDEATWQKIKDKPLFLHNALQTAESYLEMKPEERKKVKKVLPEVLGLPPPPPDDWHCKHGYVGKLCRSEGCMIEARKHERSS